jgi:hypothetical protein
MPGRRAYKPYGPLRRPAGKPDAQPAYRVLIHERQIERWERMVVEIGEESATQCWDHLAFAAASVPSINSASILKGKQYAATADGFSRVIHYRTGSAWRVDYRIHNEYRAGKGDPHQIVVILFVGRSSSGT